MPDLSRRDLKPELMDDPGLDVKAHARALAGLARINRLSNSAGILWPPIARLARSLPPGRPLRVLDVATGAGDVPVALARKAVRAALAVEWAGCDISPVALTASAARGQAGGVSVTLFQHDALATPLPGSFDVVMCSLFLHHLTDEEAVRLLRTMGEAAGRVVLVNDLNRTHAGFWAAWVGTRLLTTSPVVHYDGPQSVRAAYTPDEARRLAESAGLVGVTVRPRWPFRWLLEWHRPESERKPE
jgi:SAM-dependent methyltransferase